MDKDVAMSAGTTLERSRSKYVICRAVYGGYCDAHEVVEDGVQDGIAILALNLALHGGDGSNMTPFSRYRQWWR